MSRVGSEYYLADNVHFRKMGDNEELAENEFIVEASLTDISKRGARGIGYCYTSQNLMLARYDIDFKILPKRTFEKLFLSNISNYKSPTITKNIYDLTPEIRIESSNRHNVIATIPGISPTVCSGHFKSFSSPPLSLVSHLLGNIGGRHALNIDKEANTFVVTEVLVEPKKLIPSGVDIQTRCSLHANSGNKFSFNIEGSICNDTVIKMKLDLETRTQKDGNTKSPVLL